MSRQTVIALYRFTEKLAEKADELELPSPSGEKAEVKPTPRGVSPGVGKSGKPLVPNVTTPPKAYKAPPAPPAATPSWWEENVAPLISGAGEFIGQNGLPMAAGMGLGGLGAYGLSRLFSSKKKDEEESSFPWLSTLLGVGGGGALAAYLSSRANQTTPSMGLGANDLAAIDPHAAVPSLQTTRPTSTAGLV
jgi:hypothetical protein